MGLLAAVTQLFNMQKNFIASLIRIPIPLMMNVDRIQQEHSGNEKIIERSMRQWAESLMDAKGRLMQCNVKNRCKKDER
jgi:hypothetical protein